MDCCSCGWLRCVLPQGALERLGLPSNESYVETLLRQYDGDQDGCVNYQDFASYVQKNEARIWQAFRCLAHCCIYSAIRVAGHLSADVLISLGVQSASTICGDVVVAIVLLSHAFKALFLGCSKQPDGVQAV